MKLLFDENLSPRLVTALSDLFPESAHVDRLGLGSKPDAVIWEYAKTHGYVLVSKDSDFHERSLLYGHPPKVVWIRRGNCSVRQIELILRTKASAIERLAADGEMIYLILL
jgi:predicted nuclease of predicted toxin-antitoxin system